MCLISESPLFEAHKIILTKLSELVIQRISNVKTNEKLSLEFYLSMIFYHLYFRLDQSNEIIIMLNKQPLIKYINWSDGPISLDNFTYSTLLRKIPFKNILDLIKMLLLERKIIIISDTPGEIAVIIESLLKLIKPL